MRKAIGYTRVSTTDQAVEGVSLEAQEKMIEEHCKSKGWELVEIFSDKGMTGRGSMEKRPGITEAIEKVCEVKGAFVSYSLSRVARSTQEALKFGDKLKRCGAGLALISDDVDTTSANGHFFFTMMAAFAELESNLTSERTRSALAHLKKTGKRYSRNIPYGQQLAEDGKSLIPHPEEQTTIAIAKALADQGLSLRKIGASLEAQGRPPRKAKKWSAVTVRTLVNHND